MLHFRLADLEPGSQIGRYQLIRLLGKGGMGAVFLAKDMELGREIALKFLMDMSEQHLLRFQREAKAIASLKHPNIENTLTNKLVDAVRAIRDLDLKKKPCISETLDWAQSLIILQATDLSTEILSETLGVLVKYRSDSDKVRENLKKIEKSAGLSCSS